MSRLMSVAHTEEAVRAQRKTVTRRLGWLFLRPGDTLTLCRKVMGRKPGEPLVRIADVEVLSVRRERLADMDPGDLEREAVPPAKWWTPAFAPQNEYRGGEPAVELWVNWFARAMGCTIADEVTRIEWRYLDPRPADIPGPRRCSS